MRTNYNVEITKSVKPLTPKQKIMFKDLANAESLDRVVNTDESLILDVENIITLQVHNEKAENPDYMVFLVFDGTYSYYTSSESFGERVYEIYETMQECEEPWQLKIYKKESANYKGKYFITCSVI